MKKSDSGTGSLILGLLGIAFVVLKLIGVIKWSWWYVTLPFYAPIVICLVFLLVIGVLTMFKGK